MKGGRKEAFALAAILGGILLTAGCASDTRHQWLTFFFDGVPAPGSQTNAVAAAAAAETTPAVEAKPVAPPPDTSSTHPPFRDQQCAQCHQSSTGMGLRLQPPQLCWSCHKDFLAEQKVKHQPVESGDCASCHDPHRSGNKNLLLKKGNEVCLTCHDDPLAAGKIKHQAVESGSCLDCHAPHASNFKGLLKKSVKETCGDCHEDLIG